MIPMDLMSLQPRNNLDHVEGGRARPEQCRRRPATTLIEWAKAMTKRDGDKVTRSGI